MMRLIKKLKREFLNLICKTRGHNYLGYYNSRDHIHAKGAKGCKRCGFCVYCWGWRGDIHWWTGYQVDDDRWIK